MPKRKSGKTPPRRTSFALNSSDAKRLALILAHENAKPSGVVFTQTDIMREALYEMSKARGLEPAQAAPKVSR